MDCDVLDRIPASKLTGGKLDLLTGIVTYSCLHNHQFSWILDYGFSRAGDRWIGAHACPKCTDEEPTCLVCLGRFDARALDRCPNCDDFFVASLLEGRLERFRALNVKADEYKGISLLRCRIMRQKERFRAKYGVWPPTKVCSGDDVTAEER